MSAVPSKTPKGYRRGTHRTVPPAETLARLKPLLPQMGITRLANVTGLDTLGIPVVMAVRPNSRSISVSQGKGLDLDSAKASAAMESAEGFHAESIELPLKLASFNELRRRHLVADLERLPLSEINPFCPDLPMLWIEGKDWVQGDSVWLPFQLVHSAYTTRMQWDLRGFDATSTGLASGNHLLEAASHAICEAVERACSAKFREKQEDEREALKVDLETIDDADCRSVLERYDSGGVDVAVWNTTDDAAIPAFECIIAQRTDHPFRFEVTAHGAGCHPAREVALLRALTEAAQSRLTVISGSRDDMPRSDYESFKDRERIASWRKLTATRGRLPFSRAPRFESSSFEEDVAWEIERLKAVHCDRVIVVDLTKPEFGIPVVRAIVPGMHDKSRLAGAGRSPRGLL